jgi:predicted transcriptional regulator
VLSERGEIMQELKKFRNILNITAKEMAENIGVSKSFYEKIETGTRKASNSFISKLKKKYPQVDLNIFFVK